MSTSNQQQQPDTSMTDTPSSGITPDPTIQPTKPKVESRVPELLQWKERDMADDLAKLTMTREEKEPATKKENSDGKSESKAKAKDEQRVPELLQWKDHEMADDLSRLMMSEAKGEEKKTN